MIHTIPETAVCERFGISTVDAHELVNTWAKDDWNRLISGKEGSDFTVCDIYARILKNAFLKENEKCFLCTHVAQHWEIFVLRYTFENDDPNAFIKLLGYNF